MRRINFNVCVLSFGGMGSRYVCSRLARSQKSSVSSRIKNSNCNIVHTHDINELNNNFNRYVILYNDPLKSILSRGKRGLLLRFWNTLQQHITDGPTRNKLREVFPETYKNWKKEKQKLSFEKKSQANWDFLKDVIEQSGIHSMDFCGIFSFYDKVFQVLSSTDISPDKIFFVDYREDDFLLKLSNVVKHDISKHFIIKPRTTVIDKNLQELGINEDHIEQIKQFYSAEDSRILSQFNSLTQINQLNFLV